MKKLQQLCSQIYGMAHLIKEEGKSREAELFQQC
jgi:hypothetical protein